MNKTAQLLFEYLESIIYKPGKVELDLEQLDPEFRDLGEGMQVLATMLKEVRVFSTAISRGELDAPFPPKSNELAAPIKALHASLRHLTWQAEQVAKGDYGQRVDFMGQFSSAFNQMIEQLEARQIALEAEIQAGNQMTKALQQSNLLLSGITANIPQMIMVFSMDNSLLFSNVAGEKGLAKNPFLCEQLLTLMTEYSYSGAGEQKENNVDIKVEFGDIANYYSVSFYPLQWQGDEAMAFVVVDISEDKAHMMALEQQVYVDTLTMLNNRLYGMQKLAGYVEKQQHFTIAFVDLDNLKYVNDNLGHEVGDRYIIDAATALLAYAGAETVCRIGGDEFMLLWQDTTEERAIELLENCNKELAQICKERERPYVVSMSFGVVEVSSDNNRSSSDILALADEKMYLHKRSRKRMRGL